MATASSPLAPRQEAGVSSRLAALLLQQHTRSTRPLLAQQGGIRLPIYEIERRSRFP